MEMAAAIAERIRDAFEAAGVCVGNQIIGATVSIGGATSYSAIADVDALLLRADGALYSAKRDGRNRFYAADEEPGSERARLAAAARSTQATNLPANLRGLLQRKLAARRARPA